VINAIVQGAVAGVTIVVLLMVFGWEVHVGKKER
jgi:hypothetical protein